ncbi:MAG TPA: flagellar biosynthesis protein FlgE [Sulfurospirillum arcachonense]|nr:flagellar biosynthesis protein FlgE [Sulfurospirillum arcachonense]
MQVNASSMMAHTEWMGNNAHNVANVNTDGFNSTQTTIQNPSEGSVQAVATTTESGTDLARELTEQIPIEKAHGANAQAVKAYDEMIGSLIDLSV